MIIYIPIPIVGFTGGLFLTESPKKAVSMMISFDQEQAL